MGSTDSLAALARPLLTEVGLELWDIELTPSMVRILVDRADGVDLDALAAATSVLSPLLDAREDLVPAGRYDLEVSSPGIERTLRTVEQYRRYVGSLLALKTTIAIGGSRRLRATLVAVAEAAIEVVIEGSPQPVTVPFEQIDRASTVLDWGPKGERGKGQPGKGHPQAQSHRSKPQPGKSTAKKVKPAKRGKPTKQAEFAEPAEPTNQAESQQIRPTQTEQSRPNRIRRLAGAAGPGANDGRTRDPSPGLQLWVEGRSRRSPKGVVPLWHHGGVVGDNQAGRTAGTSTAAGLAVAGRGAFLRSQARR